jgi:hypothetical protein
MRDCTVFVRRSAEGVDTGLAIANVSDQSAQVTLRLYDQNFKLIASQQLSDVIGPFEAGSHAALFLTELFPELDLSNLEEGVLTLESDQPVAVASLLQTRPAQAVPPGAVTLTAMPVLEGRADSESAPSYPFPRKLYLPHVGNGQAGALQMRSSLLVANLGRGLATVKVQFLDSAGQPMLFPLSGEETARPDFTLLLDSGHSARVTTDGSGPLKAGYAVMTVSGNAGAAAVYHCSQAGTPLFDAGVPVVSRYSRYSLFASVTEAQDTAFAVVNTGSKAAHGVLTLYDENGDSLGARSLSSFAAFGPGEHVARYVSALFPGVQVTNGRIVIESDQRLAGLTLRQHDDPVVPYPFDIYLLTVFPMFPLP